MTKVRRRTDRQQFEDRTQELSGVGSGMLLER